MKDKVLELFAGQNNLTWQVILMNILFSAFLGTVIYLSYYLTHRGTIYSKKFNVSLVVLTVLTGTVMTVIGNNLALSLGMVGALSIVRFRTAIKDARDTMYIFWAIIVGICCGVSDFLVSSIGSTVVFLVLFIFHSVKNDKRLLLITRERVEIIYEISSELLQYAECGKHSVCDKIYELGEIEYVNIVMQNDEISG